MTNELLVALGQEHPVFWYCDDKKKEKEERKETPIIPYEINEPDLERAKSLNLGVYFTVNQLGDVKNKNGNLRYRENVLHPLACFADFDAGTFEEQYAKIAESPLEPSAIVKSGHGYHVYWFLDKAEKKDIVRWTEIQKSIADYFSSDPAVNDPGRLMRLPTSWHCKDAEPILVTLEKCDSKLRYSLDEIATEFPPLKSTEVSSEIEKLLATTITTGGRNTAATRIIGKLLKHFRPTEWESVAWPLLQSWNKTKCNPPDSESILRGTFDSISKKEMQNKQTEDRGITIFREGDMNPTMSEENETVLVRIPTEDGTVRFSFWNIEQSKADTLNAMLSVQLIVPGSYPKPFTLRINLYSHSALESFARSLGKSLGGNLKWDHLLNTAQASLIEYLANKDGSLDLSEISDEESPMLFAPFLVKDGANLLFGDGGTGKTYFCLRLALSLATGKDFLGYTPNEATGTLFLDYEDNEKTASFRLSRLCADPELSLDPKIAKRFIRYFNPQGAPLHVIVPALKKIIAEHHIGLILVDSVASACGAEPEKAESASAYYNALKSLNITSLSIAHVVKTEGVKQDKAFGSVFWHNLARNTWNIQGEEDPEEDHTTLGAVMGERSKQLGMFHRKFNSGPKSRPINTKIIYGTKDVRFEEGKADYWNKDKKLRERIVVSLSQGKKSLKTLQEELLDVKSQTLKNTLSKMKEKNLIFKDEGKGGEYYASTSVLRHMDSTHDSTR